MIANSKKKSQKQSNGRASDSANAEDDWRPEQGKDSDGGTDDDEASQDEWEDDEECGASSSKKRKKSVKAESKPKVKRAKSGGSKAAPSYWSQGKSSLRNASGLLTLCSIVLNTTSIREHRRAAQHVWRDAPHALE